MNKLAHVLIGLTLMAFVSTSAVASIITFDQEPDDPAGSVFTINSNDGWSSGRGMRFTMGRNVTIDSFGVLQDVRSINLAYEIFDVTNNAILRSGSTGLTTTTGLEFIDVAFADLTLLNGNIYHMEFTFSGLANQNFFHDQRPEGNYNQAGFNNIDGTIGGPNGTGNFVIAQFRVNEVMSVPEPVTLTLMGLGLAGIGYRQRRNKKTA